MISTINKPTRVTRNTATATVPFITNTVVDTQFKSGIIQTNLSDHLPSKQTRIWLKNIMNILFIRDIMTKNQQTYLGKKLHETTWGKHTRNFSKFSVAYTCFFPKKEITVKLINLMNPWVTKGIAKSLKKKQRLYEKYLKKRGAENEKIYKKH